MSSLFPVSSRLPYLLLLISSVLPLSAQNATVSGTITDQTGAVVPGATVILTDSSGTEHRAESSQNGSYTVSNLSSGTYTMRASATGLVLAEPVSLVVKAGPQALNLVLKVQAVSQNMAVAGEAGPTVSTDPSSNAGSMVLSGNDLQALADNPEDLAEDLQALAGPAAGPSGGALYVDGFSGGQLPPKESIREIRINQNPFSPEYDKLGYGRIDIFTKPGADKLRGSAFFNLGDSVWNSRDPYAQQKAPFLLREYGGNVGGPMGKRASFMLDLEGAAIDNGAVINATTLDPLSHAIVSPYTSVFRVPQRRLEITPRVDYQLSANHTLTVRYLWEQTNIPESGVGGLNLLSSSNHVHALIHNVQVTETAVLGSSTVNETRFQFSRLDTSNLPNTNGSRIQVLGAFNGGSSQAGPLYDTQNNFEVQNNTTITHQTHTFRFGIRVRPASEAISSRQNFGGAFAFGGRLGPELDGNNQPVLDSSGNPVLISLQSIETYRRTLLFGQLGYSAAQIRALGGGATQFTMNAGTPRVSATQTDVGAFFGDDWRARQNLTLSLGVRYEGQTNIGDWHDFSPRVGVAWQPHGKSKWVLRAGFGMFYDRFALGNVLTALRYNGVVQQQYVVQNPDFFPNIPSVAGLSASVSSIQALSPLLRAPYIMQSVLSLERQLGRGTTLAVTYANSHGLHQFRTEDANAPLPGTYNPSVPGSGVFPLGHPGAVLVMSSDGLYTQNQVLANVNSKLNDRFSIFARYTFNRALSNTDGLGTVPANPYNFAGEYGPASTDVRNAVVFGGSFERWNFRISPLLTLRSRPPFDITVGHDVFGDTLFNARPGIATDANRPGLVQTAYGLLDPNPVPGEQILSRNYGRGPGFLLFNLRLTKTFQFGRVARSATTQGSASSVPEYRYTWSVAAAFRNLVNHNNPGPIMGNIASSFFGRANQSFGSTSLGGTNLLESANNRRLELQTRFSF